MKGDLKLEKLFNALASTKKESFRRNQFTLGN